MRMIYQINPEIVNAENVVIYGAGTSGERLLSQLLYDEIYVTYFCDSNPKMWGKKVLNKKVISPDELKEISGKSAVLISSVYWKDIYEELQARGIQNLFVTHKDVFGQPKS